MHVMHLIDSLAVGGAERALVEIASGSQREGIQVSACVSRQSTDLAAGLPKEVRLHVLNRRKRFDWRPMRRLARLVESGGVDLLHVHGRSSFSLAAFLGALGWIRCPLVFHDHLPHEAAEPRPPGWMRRWAGPKAAQYVACCEGGLAWAERAGIDKRRHNVIPPAITLAARQEARSWALREKLGLSPDTLAAITVSGIRPVKGIDVLIEAAAGLGGSSPIRFLIAGGARDPEHLRHCRQRVEQLRLGDRVQFLGERRDIAELLSAADFAIHPSRWESGPIALIEYLAAGLPVICTRTGGIAARAEARGAGYYVEPGQAEPLRAAIRRLAALTPESRREQGLRCSGIAREEFDISRVMPRWHEVYGKALAARQSL